jgi:hypothetical protein
MKKNIILFCLILFQFSFSQQQKPDYLLDPIGNKYNNISGYVALRVKYPDYSIGFRITKDSGHVYQHNVLTYSTYKVNYKTIKDSLQKLTTKKFNDSTIFLIQYNYKDDICSSSSSNNMTRYLVSKRKSYFDAKRKRLEKKNNIIFLVLFEKGIQLKNKKNKKKEYFFSDSLTFFRTNMFLNPVVCGSYALIKPDGLTLVRNGEYMVDSMVDHLDPIIWDTIFNLK